MELLYTPSSTYKKMQVSTFSECIIDINNILFSLQRFFVIFMYLQLFYKNFNRVNLVKNSIPLILQLIAL